MGDIADMMLDGTLCEQCGVYLGNAVDHPRLCPGCQRDARQQAQAQAPAAPAKRKRKQRKQAQAR